MRTILALFIALSLMASTAPAQAGACKTVENLVTILDAAAAKSKFEAPKYFPVKNPEAQAFEDYMNKASGDKAVPVDMAVFAVAVGAGDAFVVFYRGGCQVDAYDVPLDDMQTLLKAVLGQGV